MKNVVLLILLSLSNFVMASAKIDIATEDAEGIRWIELQVNEIQNVYGMQVELNYNPSELQVVDASSKTGVQVHSSNFFPDDAYDIANTVNTRSGNIRYAVSLLKPAEEISGSGSLIKLGFKTLTPEVASLQVETIKFGNKNGKKVAVQYATDIGIAPALSLRSENVTDKVAYQYDSIKKSTVTSSTLGSSDGLSNLDPVLLILLGLIVILLLVVIILLARRKPQQMGA